jgi:hypothetical protein
VAPPRSLAHYLLSFPAEALAEGLVDRGGEAVVLGVKPAVEEGHEVLGLGVGATVQGDHAKVLELQASLLDALGEGAPHEDVDAAELLGDRGADLGEGGHQIGIGVEVDGAVVGVDDQHEAAGAGGLLHLGEEGVGIGQVPQQQPAHDEVLVAGQREGSHVADLHGAAAGAGLRVAEVCTDPAFAAAEVLTMTLISGLSIEFPFLLIAYRSSAVAQKIMQILVPYLIGAAATVGLLPKADDIIPLCERALRAAISANVGPIMRRFEGPIMEAISQAGKTMGPRSRGDRPDRADQSDENWK